MNPQGQNKSPPNIDSKLDANESFPFQVMSLERGENQVGRSSGWSNTFIVKVDKRSGETWILSHIPGNSHPDDKKYDHHLRWVPIPDHFE